MPLTELCDDGLLSQNKIVQLPFCLPELVPQQKEAYLNKIVHASQLEPTRVLEEVRRTLHGTGISPNKHKDDVKWLAAYAKAAAKLLPVERRITSQETQALEEAAYFGSSLHRDRMEGFLVV
eukprot:4885809-Pleurochrysis_carterae.AAC.1